MGFTGAYTLAFLPAKPAQLTNGPLDFDWAVPSKDGKKIFTVGSQRRGELIRYDGKMVSLPI